MDVSKWISVKERLPENGETVIMAHIAEGSVTGFYATYGGYWAMYTAGRSIRLADGEVTHWMPLPEPPEKGDE